MTENKTEQFKIILEYIKDLSIETPSATVLLSVRENLTNYQMDIDISSLALKNKSLEITTKLILQDKKNVKDNLVAFDSGYTKSRTAILDANITTLLAAIILFFMGSGPIKGFSLTLGIGIFTTLFTVYFIARLLTVLYVSKNKEKEGLI